MVCILLWSSALRVHDSQAYRKMDVTREGIRRILELREILPFQNGFNLVNAAVVCAVLESISRLEPSSVITEPRYLKIVTVSSFCPFTLISVLIPLVLCVISLIFSALISMRTYIGYREDDSDHNYEEEEYICNFTQLWIIEPLLYSLRSMKKNLQTLILASESHRRTGFSDLTFECFSVFIPEMWHVLLHPLKGSWNSADKLLFTRQLF